MKVCVIGDFSRNLDEGLKNISYYTARSLSQKEGVVCYEANIKKILSMSRLREIREFHPDIIHYIPGATNKTILFLKFLKWYLNGHPKVVLSVQLPIFDDSIFYLSNFTPDLVIASSNSLKKRLDLLNLQSICLPNGVDSTKFVPVNAEEKEKLREIYGLQKDLFTLLHVGHLMTKRNLPVLKEAAEKFQVVIVASHYLKKENNLYQTLKRAGCTIFEGYYPNIEDFYQLSDCYVFPVVPGGTLECPLSVLEAMSCNLPVITTNYDGILTFFADTDGLVVVEEERDIIPALEAVRGSENPVMTRSRVQQYSWHNLTDRYISMYETLMS